MHEIKADSFLSALKRLHMLQAFMKGPEGAAMREKKYRFNTPEIPNSGLEPPLGRSMRAALRQDLSNMGLDAALVALDRLSHYIERESAAEVLDPETITELCRDVENRTIDQLGSKIFLYLSSSERALWTMQSPFGADVELAFPNAAEDIQEAGKCLALGRYTASVFHLMRALEIAVQRLAAHLQIVNVDRVWGHLLSDIARAVEAMEKGPMRTSWSEIQVLLYHVKQAWRNEAMHPKATYTREQATEVYHACRAFMAAFAGLLKPVTAGATSADSG